MKSQSNFDLYFPMDEDVKHTFKYFSDIWVYSIENPLFKSVPNFWVALFVFLMSYILIFLYILDVKWKIFYHSVGLILMKVPFALKKLFSFVWFHLLIIDHRCYLCSVQKIVYYANVLKAILHYFSIRYCFCVDTFDPLGLEFYAGW